MEVTRSPHGSVNKSAPDHCLQSTLDLFHPHNCQAQGTCGRGLQPPLPMLYLFSEVSELSALRSWKTASLPSQTAGRDCHKICCGLLPHPNQFTSRMALTSVWICSWGGNEPSWISHQPLGGADLRAPPPHFYKPSSKHSICMCSL